MEELLYWQLSFRVARWWCTRSCSQLWCCFRHLSALFLVGTTRGHQLVVGDWLLVPWLGLQMKSMYQYCHQHRHLGPNWGSLHPNCSESPALILNLVEDFLISAFWFSICASWRHIQNLQCWMTEFRVGPGGTADACNCIISMRNSRTNSSPSDVMELWDSRSVRFLNDGACNFAVIFATLFLSWEFCFSSSSRSRSISGPAADWTVRDSSNISRHCSVSWTNSVRCWCSPAYYWLCCCETSSACTRRVNVQFCFHTSDVTSVTKISLFDLWEFYMLPEKLEITVPSVFEKIAHLLLVVELASAHKSCALRCFLPKALTRFCLAAASYWRVAARSVPSWWSKARWDVSRWSFRASRACCVTKWTVSTAIL